MLVPNEWIFWQLFSIQKWLKQDLCRSVIMQNHRISGTGNLQGNHDTMRLSKNATAHSLQYGFPSKQLLIKTKEDLSID